MGYTLEQREHAAASVKSVLWARLAVNHTKKTFSLSCLVPLVMLVIVIFTGFDIDNPGANDFVIRNDLRTLLDDGRQAARDDFPFTGRDDDANVSKERTRYARDDSFSILFRGRVGLDGPVGRYNDSDTEAFNVLTKEGIALMKKAEDDIFDDPEYKKICLSDPSQVDCSGNVADCVRPSSILSSKHLYGLTNSLGEVCGRRNGSAQVLESQFAAFLDELVQDGNVISRFAGYIGKDFSPDSPSRTTWISQSFFRVGLPFRGFFSINDQGKEQDTIYNDFVVDVEDRIKRYSSRKIDVYLVGVSLADNSFDHIVLRDLSFSIAAIVLVFVAICIHTTSPFLATASMFQIFLAFPLSYVLYRFVLQQKYFAALQILVIFLILGIGADDVFVFTDAWKQAGVVLGTNCDLVTRMSWTYRRSVKAMGVTSVTTAAAFFVTATSPIMPIGTLGIWAGVLVLLQFFLVITIYPSAIIIWHRFFRVRTFTNCFNKPDKGRENEPVPSVWSRWIPAKWRSERATGVQEYRAVERLFRGPWVNLVNKLRFGLVMLGAILVGLSIWRATLLTSPDEREEFLPSSHPVRVALTTLVDAFPTSEADDQLRVRITWGILGVDRTGTSRFDPGDPGKAVLDEAFDLKLAASQRHVLEACEFFEGQDDLIFQGNTIERVVCWARDFEDWRNKYKGETEFKTYATDKEFITELIEFARQTFSDGSQPYLKYLNGQHLIFNNATDKIIAAEITFVSPLKAAVPYKVIWPVYNMWQDQLKLLNERAPNAGMDKAICTGGYTFLWQITQRTLGRAMFVGIGIMLGVAFVALTVSTLNWYVAMLATLTIGSIVAMLVGVIQLLGWQLGITESIGVVIAVGYSFDGAAHIATAYVESKSSDRFNRTRDALTDLGISILFGAITTLLAGFMLFPAIIIFFKKFAGLIVTTVALGMIWSLIFFPAMLLIVGPTGCFGDLKPIFHRACALLKKKSPSSSKLDTSEARGSNDQMFSSA